MNNRGLQTVFGKLVHYIVRPKAATMVLLNKCPLFRLLPDKTYLKIQYRLKMGKKLNLKNPQAFNEKLQWLKLYDRKSEYTEMVDKYEVRKYIAEKIGEEYLIPLLGVWDSFEDIDFEVLPNQFALKCTHDSGGLIICKDKSKLDLEAARKKINKCLKTNYFYNGREWPYKYVRPRIIAEKYIADKNLCNEKNELVDYKLYCFNGKPEFGYVSQGLENHKTARISYVTLDWQQADFRRNDFASFEQLPPKPKNLEKMLELAKILSDGTKFLRVDFYEIDEKIYFGELTFFPGSGFTKLYPEKWDYKLGEMIKLYGV